MPKCKVETRNSEPIKFGTAQEMPEMEPMPDTVPSRRLVPDGAAVRVRRPPYPTPPKQSDGSSEPKPKEHFPVDWRPTNTLPSGLQRVDSDRLCPDASEVAHAAPLPVGRPGHYERYDPRRRTQARIRRAKRLRRTEVGPPEAEGPNGRTPEAPSGRDPSIRVPVRSAFRGLPRIARYLLRRGATAVQVSEGESVEFGMAFIARGKLCAHPGPMPMCGVALHAGTLVRRLPRGVAMAEVRWVACGGPVSLVTWDEATTERLLSLSPLLAASLCAAAHRINAQVCATTGPLGESVCASMREDLFARARLRMLAADEVLFEVGDVLPGLVITGVGRLKQSDREGRETLLKSGDVACPTAVFSQASAPVTLRALEDGASVLIADRSTLLELACAMPSLPELLGLY
jgi:hypothetical protein